MIGSAIVFISLASAGWQAPDTKPAVTPAKPAARIAAISPKPIKPPEPLPKGEKVAQASLELDPKIFTLDFNRRSMLMSFPNQIVLLPKKPSTLTKEPNYVAKPLYGEVVLGDPSRPGVIIVFDENEAESRIYIDANRNGDLTDDPKVSWESQQQSKNPATGEPRTVTSGFFVFPAAFGDKLVPYGLTLNRAKNTDRLSVIRTGGRKGSLTIGAKSYPIFLAENTSTAVFDNVVAAKARKPGVWLLIDINGDGNFKPNETAREVHDTSKPIPIEGEWYAAEFTADGGTLSLYKTPAPPKVVEAPRNPLLKAGQKAPDFDFVLAGGKPAKLSNYRGKLRILDMWATWCGPCLAAMPKVEHIYQQVKDQDVVVIGLDVMDEREAYEKWLVSDVGKKYHFTFGADPNEYGHKSGGISGAWGVYAIPTTFVIDKDDTILLVLQGLTAEGHAKLIKVLNDKGIKVKAD